MNQVFEILGKKHSTSRNLISTMKAKKILLKSSLLKWYLKHGLIVTKIYGIIPAQPTRIYENFMDWVSDLRREGDVLPEFAVKADNAKNIGCSGFGQSIMNKDKHINCRFIDEEEKFNRIKNTYWFYNAEEYLKENNDSIFEVQSKKKIIKEDNPIQNGSGILQDSKLRMLQFYYDCLDKYYVDRSDFQLIQIDTD